LAIFNFHTKFMQTQLNLAEKTGIRGASPVAVIIILAVGALLAIVIGTQLGSADYVGALSWFVIGLGIVHILYLYRFTWQIGLLLSFVGFNYYPIGFGIEPGHLALVLAILLVVLSVVSSSGNVAPAGNGRGLGFVKLMLVVWVAYGAIHFAYTYVNPYDASEFSLKSALKSYFGAFAGALVLGWFIFKPQGIAVPKNWATGVIFLLFLGLVTNIGFRIYFYRLGIGIDESSAREAPFQVPVLNAVPSLYVLRGLGPLAVAFTYVFMTSPGWMQSRKRLTQLVVLATFCLGIIGAGVSGGRGAVLLVVLYIGGIAFMRRQVGVLGCGAAVAVLMFAAINVFGKEINKHAPFFVARSLQYFMIEKGDANKSIQSSTSWRSKLFWMAIYEWQSSPRVFLTGRSTYVFNAGDRRVTELHGGYEGGLTTSLRRGVTHALITDLLVQYGITGALIYLVVKISFLRLAFLTFRWASQRRIPDLANLGLMLFVIQFADLPLTFVASGWLSFIWVWLMIVMITLMGKSEREKVPASEVALPVDARLSPAS
jgi:hypothetical protein